MDDELKSALLALVILLVLSILCWAVGYGIGSQVWKAEAVKQGAAVWQCDPKTGATHFVWLPKERTNDD